MRNHVPAFLDRLLRRGNEDMPDVSFAPAGQKAVIRASICTGEKVAGFRDPETGHFTEVMLIRSPEDLDAFRRRYHITDITTEY